MASPASWLGWVACNDADLTIIVELNLSLSLGLGKPKPALAEVT